MMNINNVKNLYALGHAEWYDPFKKIWNRLVATKAEENLTVFLKTNLDETKSILELGCGTALNLEKILTLNLKFKKYLGLDFSPDMLKIAKSKFEDVSNVKFQQKDITYLEDIDEKFDIIICTWVLSHLPSPSQVINQAQKLLSPQGRLFLIFFSKPKWFVNIWLYPFAKYLFKTNPLSDKEVSKFMNVKTKHKFSANITTIVVIHK